MWCRPFAALVLSQGRFHGADASATATPSTYQVTWPALDARASSVVVPLTVTPARGEVTDTAGPSRRPAPASSTAGPAGSQPTRQPAAMAATAIPAATMARRACA